MAIRPPPIQRETKASDAGLTRTVIDVSAARWATATGAGPEPGARDPSDPFRYRSNIHIGIRMPCPRLDR